MSQHLRENSRT